MEPEDSYRSVRLGAAELAAGDPPRCTTGRTTLVVRSMLTPNCRACATWASGDVSLDGTPVGMADDAPMDFAGLARVKKEWIPDKDNLLTLGICSRNLGALTIGGSAAATSRGDLTIEQIKRDWNWWPVLWACPLPCTRLALVRSWNWSGPGCSAPTYSSSIRC